MTLSEPRPYKKHTKKKRREYIQQKGRGIIYMVLLTFTSVVQVLDYVDKNHMNNHYFCCSHLNKLKIVINLTKNNNKEIQHYTSFSVGSLIL